jgi:broad specificity phosphatase PhoE
MREGDAEPAARAEPRSKVRAPSKAASASVPSRVPTSPRKVFGTLVCVTHGPLETHLEQAAIGSLDAPPSIEAETLEPTVAATLAAFSPDATLSSDAARCARPAARIAEAAGVRHVVKKALRARDFGRFEGRLWPRIVAEEPKEAVAFLRAFASAAPPGGEALPEVSERVVRALELEMRRRPRKTIVWVADPTPIRCALARFLDLSLESVQRMKLDPYGATILRIQADASSLACLNVPVDGALLQNKVW